MATTHGLVAFSDIELDGLPRIDSTAGESVCAVQTNVGIVLDNGPLQQPGTLHVTTKRLIWISDIDKHGYAVDFLSLSMHAISRDPEAYPLPCIYTQIETDDSFVSGDEDMEERHGNGDLSEVQEMRLIPSDPNAWLHLEVESLFKTFCDCALLNPDPEVELEGEGDWYFNEEEVLAGAIGQSNGIKGHEISDLSKLNLDDEQFEDADEDEI